MVKPSELIKLKIVSILIQISKSNVSCKKSHWTAIIAWNSLKFLWVFSLFMSLWTIVAQVVKVCF